MSKYGRIKITNLSLCDKMFCKVCDVLNSVFGHSHHNKRAYFVYGIENNKTEFNVDRGTDTQQSVRHLDMAKFYINRDFPGEVQEGLQFEYLEL
jgi:hypothetical protein